MSANKKLSHLLAGHTIQHAAPGQNGKGEPVLVFTFDDGSTLNVKTATDGSSSTVAAGSGKVLGVREEGASVHLDLEGGASVALTLANPGNGFELRDKTGKLEYLG